MKKDVLNRDNDVNLIFNIVEKYSESKEYVSFGLDGEQGVGKTFVVEQLNEKLKETKKKDEPKYFVINYNCWENDYYNDPLNGILISINNTIEESKNIFSETFKKVLKEVGKDLSKLFMGLAVTSYPFLYLIKIYIVSLIKRINKPDESLNYVDENKNLVKVLLKVRKCIEKITSKKTIVIIIDELDRCLPEYQIKVLERLHHVFNELGNTIQITVFDKKLIENSIFSIFGNNISVDRYLDKFIAFLLNIGHGQCQEIILDEYHGLFGTKNMRQQDKEFIKDLINSSGINIRTLKKMMANIELINKVIGVNFDHQNYVSIIEFEILLVLLRLSVQSIKDELRISDNKFLIANEIDILRRILKNEQSSELWRYNKDYVDTIIMYFRRMKEVADMTGIVNTLFDSENSNILLCKVLLSLNYNFGKYSGAIWLENDALEICKNAVKYIDMFYPK